MLSVLMAIREISMFFCLSFIVFVLSRFSKDTRKNVTTLVEQGQAPVLAEFTQTVEVAKYRLSSKQPLLEEGEKAEEKVVASSDSARELRSTNAFW
jgi:hypothetical protein